ncbi:MAG TPA: hypothetical protein VME70_00225 [Mycobacteriales bacterium]|nr:hypothetical protein [Mycobacteriales bacterium]
MLQQLMVEAMARDRMRVSDERVRRAYVRQLAVVRRRQRRVEAARRHLVTLSAL